MNEDGWTALSKDFIASWNDEERLASIVEKFNAITDTYNVWLLRYFDEIFASDYVATDQLIKEWRDSFK